MNNYIDCAINGDANYRNEGNTPKAALGLKAAPPPTAQTSLRRRQEANAERMRTRWQGGGWRKTAVGWL
ncbi:MAG: hypothetical protein LBK66_09935 [Spirochaetaceae bacterium]|nr:hypothetical protein [Spirochaetaceae bacterium]